MKVRDRSEIKKGCCLGCLVCVALLVGLITVVMVMTRPVVNAAILFLEQVSAGQTAEAYHSTATGFQGKVSQPEFEQYIKKSGLDGYASASWSTRKWENSYGFVAGTVKTREGKEIPLSITLLYEEQRWKVAGFDDPPAEVP